MRFLALDALRGLFALGVVFHHLQLFVKPAPEWLLGSAFISHCYLGVDFFFVLSGFVLTHGYHATIKTSGDFYAFMLRRFGRIYPLHAFILALLVFHEPLLLLASKTGAHVPYAPFTEGNSLEHLVKNLLMLNFLNWSEVESWNLPSWSIATEFYTYIMFALLAYRCKTARLPFFMVLVSGLGFMLLSLFHGGSYISPSHSYSALFRCMYGFFAGGAAYFVFAKLKQNFVFSRAMLSLCEIIAVCAAVIFIDRTEVTFYSLAAPMVFVPVIILFACEGGIVSKILNLRVFQILGKYSYTIYISHFFLMLTIYNSRAFIQTYFDFITLLVPDHSFVVQQLEYNIYIALFFALQFWLARLLFNVIENPARLYFNKLADGMLRAKTTHEPQLAIKTLDAEPA